MDKKKAQLNVQIDPLLLITIKAEAIKSGKTLTAFVTERLAPTPVEAKDEILEQRLVRIEKQLDSLSNFTRNFKVDAKISKSIFSDSGAKKYGEVARESFEWVRKERKLSLEDAFGELAEILVKYPNAQSGLVFGLLSGEHVLTGLEMTNAYKNGSFAMRNALNEWTNSSLEPLNEAFLNAVEIGSLV